MWVKSLIVTIRQCFYEFLVSYPRAQIIYFLTSFTARYGAWTPSRSSTFPQTSGDRLTLGRKGSLTSGSLRLCSWRSVETQECSKSPTHTKCPPQRAENIWREEKGKAQSEKHEEHGGRGDSQAAVILIRNHCGRHGVLDFLGS